jgi:phospholipase C
MTLKNFSHTALRAVKTGLVSAAMFQLALGNAFAAENPQPQSRDNDTATPIKHVIVIIGENRSFDHVFATFVPRKPWVHVHNLLSEGIVKADGTPGPNFSKAAQKAATDQKPDAFLLDPEKTSFPGDKLPAPLVGGPKDSYIAGDSLTLAQQSENGLTPEGYQELIGGGTGQTSQTPDERITDVDAIPAGPFQLTNTAKNGFNYDSYAASPVHRFYQMWQQLDCSLEHASWDNPSGCDAKLFPWVEVTVGAGTNGLAQPANFSTEYSTTAATTGEGSTAMGFYNVQKGDVPYFKYLADTYAMSDNFHQSVNGGTGANHIMFGHADAIWFSDGDGHAAVPPHNQEVWSGTLDAGVVDEIENPNPAKGTNNWYTEDGYGGGGFGNFTNPPTSAPQYGGGSYSDCADTTQPGVAPIADYLHKLNIDPRCEAGHYYLLNNYNPGYFGNGNNAYTDHFVYNTAFTIPPSSTPSIGDDMLKANVSWVYYGDQWNNYVPDPYQLNYGAIGALTDEYCTICNPFQYDTSIMKDPTIRNAHIQDTANLYANIANGYLPAVSIVKPSGLVDGHPASSKLDLFESFVKKIVDGVHADPKLWASTAIFITEDEGGGYYDSGYVQPLDFFGDGTRIIFLAVSPYARPGYIAHEYADHVSIDKFIEANWGLPTITRRSRDNFPNPISAPGNPYVPVNSPALDDLFSLFDFSAHW